jgi:hypothetical protein
MTGGTGDDVLHGGDSLDLMWTAATATMLVDGYGDDVF